VIDIVSDVHRIGTDSCCISPILYHKINLAFLFAADLGPAMVCFPLEGVIARVSKLDMIGEKLGEHSDLRMLN
jgi:hypothetical protein